MKILFYQTASGELLHLRELASCCGIEAQLRPVTSSEGLIRELEQASHSDGPGMVLDVATLAELADEAWLQEFAALLERPGSPVLLFAATGSNLEGALLARMTNGCARPRKADAASPSTRVRFGEEARSLSGPLAGESFPRKPSPALALEVASREAVDIIMELDEQPAFLRLKAPRAHVFVWGSSRIFDMRRPLASEREFEEALDEYVPAIIFLRSAFGHRCWHNPMLGAGLVIDDPLLNRRYGFLDFPKLLSSARTLGYCVTLAFIPWNHWRSRRKSVKQFIDHSDCFSICAHGCDHTRNEFRSWDYDDLLSRNFLARQRMDRHQERTGILWDPLMVCPQEQYSLEGLRAFADSRQFLAMVNTACMPREGSADRLRGADLLMPAQDSYFGFPIFKRHYWKDMSVFAMALFLGKPAILVEHHEFFRNGTGGAERFVAGLRRMSPQVPWKPLIDTVVRTHWRRRDGLNRWRIHFFTDRFVLDHNFDQPTEYQFTRRISESAKVKAIQVNGKPADFSREANHVSFQANLNRARALEVQIVIDPIRPGKAAACGPKYQAGVAIRRGLSELRDNLVVRNRSAAEAAKALARFFKASGGS